MTKIDLTGNSGWQSKSSDKLKELQKGDFEHGTLILTPDKIKTDWLQAGTIAQIDEGELILIIGEEELKYEAGEVIVFNEYNTKAVKVEILQQVVLQVFKPK